jgi:hypothetical protein
MKKIAILFITILAFACEKQALEPNVYKIDKELDFYLQTFISEAKQRGIEIVPENLILTLAPSTEDLCGKYSKDKNGQRTVLIVKNGFCWDGVSRQNQEALVFHELGHCFLGRSHRDDILPNGSDASVMNSKSYGPYEPCPYDFGQDNEKCNKTYRRAYYVDELFDSKTGIPTWGKK